MAIATTIIMETMAGGKRLFCPLQLSSEQQWTFLFTRFFASAKKRKLHDKDNLKCIFCSLLTAFTFFVVAAMPIKLSCDQFYYLKYRNRIWKTFKNKSETSFKLRPREKTILLQKVFLSPNNQVKIMLELCLYHVTFE